MTLPRDLGLARPQAFVEIFQPLALPHPPPARWGDRQPSVG
jgi:hypothetical protein